MSWVEMKTDLSTILQTLTPESASVLNRSIAEAGRRNHGQTTPLHVAATLLASPTGLLRQACMSSHPNSSHPLHCRALDLCFRVALERLPSAGRKVSEMPLSNALTAALKRAQAHQRRGCPENQQQPLLAIKVELQQLIISILDDPSVSKVMREARFSSPAVKAVIEQLMSAPIGNRLRPPSLPVPVPAYMSPRLQEQGNSFQPGDQRNDEAKKVIDIMMRRNKRNPILVGESEPAAVINQVLRMIENGEGLLKNAEVIKLDNHMPIEIKELGGLIQSRIKNSNNRGIVLVLGDLKWLVELPVSDTARDAVAEMGKILSAFIEGGRCLWLIGTANCETYLRCQVYHTSMEKDWDLQAVPLASRSPHSGIIPRSGIHNPYVNPLIHLKSSPRALCCPICTNNYEIDLAKAEAKRAPLLPRWLQNAKANSHEIEHDRSKISQELHKKWMDICLLIHPTFHQNHTPKIHGQTLQLSTNPAATPVRTDLVLGRERPDNRISSQKFSKGEDAEAFKKLLKGLMEKSWWQKEAASELATAITQTRSGNGKQRCGLTKGDVWLLFAGPDRVSKSKMAVVLAEQLCGTDPIVIQLGNNDWKSKSRGKTSLDRMVEAVRMNPFAVIVLEDVDKADTLLRGSIKQAMETGRLTDSYGREISLGNIIFILTVKPGSMDDPNETKYVSISGCDRRVKVSVQEHCLKRRANWLVEEEENRVKLQRKGTSLDLNVLAGDDNDNSTDPHELAIHVDATIVFKPVNFEAMGREIESKIRESFAGIVGKEHRIELEGAAVEKVVGETWLGTLSLDEWIVKVVSPIFGQLRGRVSGETMVVRLQLEEGGLDHEINVDSGRGKDSNGCFLVLK